MAEVRCPECDEGFSEKEFHWVTNAEGGVMYRLPCDHMVVGTWEEGVTTYGPEHATSGQARRSRPHHHDHHYHQHFIDYLDKLLEEKAHEN